MLNYFTSFDKLIGSKLIVILYFLGLAGIALGVLGGVFGGLGMMGYSFFGGVGFVIASLIGGAVGVVFWRFVCELYILLFRMADDLREIRNDKISAPPASEF